MKRVVILLVPLFFLFCLASIFGQTVLLGTTGSSAGGELYSIDQSTGAAVPIGALVDSSSNAYAVTGLAFDNLTGVLYGSTSTNSPTGAKSLVTIDPLTGAVTEIGSFGTSSTMADLTFDAATATLYGSGSLDGDLYSINLTTGVATVVGASGLSGIKGAGLAISSGGDVFGAPRGANQQLVMYSKSDGSVVTVATLSGAPFPSGSIAAMTFGSGAHGATLYGINVDLNDTARPTHLVTIDPTTGAVTDVGASANGLDAIAFVTVPEPTTIAMMAFGACLLVGVQRFRRKLR